VSDTYTFKDCLFYISEDDGWYSHKLHRLAWQLLRRQSPIMGCRMWQSQTLRRHSSSQPAIKGTGRRECRP
jgi:hypothetical protein